MAKTVLVNLHVDENVRNDFKIVARLRGLTMSALINQFMVKTIRDEKEYNPQAFPDYAHRHRMADKKPSDFLADIFDGEPSEPQKKMIRETVAAIVRNSKAETPGRVIARIEPGEPRVSEKDELREAFNNQLGQPINIRSRRKR